MLHLLMAALTQSSAHDMRGVHFHLDDSGRKFACHEWRCSPAKLMPYQRTR